MSKTYNKLKKESAGIKVEDKFEIKSPRKSNTVDQAYIDSFTSRYNTLLNGYQKDFDSLTYSNRAARYDNAVRDWTGIQKDAEKIGSYIRNNGTLKQNQDYKKFLDSVNKNSTSILNSYKDKNNFFSQFDSEESYNQAIKDYDRAVKLNSMTLEDIDNNIADIDNQINDIRNKKIASYQGSNDVMSDLKQYDSQIAELEDEKHWLKQNRYKKGAEKLENVAGTVTFKGFADKGAAVQNPDLSQTYNVPRMGVYGSKVENPVTFIRENADNGVDSGVVNIAGLDKYNDIDWKKRIKAMNETEVDIYNYYLAKDGRQAADNYLDSIEERLTQRQVESEFPKYEGNTAYELAFGIAAGLDQFKSGISNLFSDRDYIPASIKQTLSGQVREDLSDDGFALPDWMGGASLGQAAYDFVTTGSNMIPSIAASVVVSALNPTLGATVGAGLMGASAGGNAFQEMINLGYDKGQARTYAILTGASEAALQEVIGGIPGVGNVLTDKGLEKVAQRINNAFFKTAVKIGGNMFAEGTEEFLQEVLTPYFKAIATGEDPESINWEEAIYSGVLGALTAAPSNIGRSTINAIQDNRTFNNLYRGSEAELIESGLETDAQSEAYKLAQKYQAKMNDGKKLSGLQLGELAKANENFNIAEDISTNKEEAKNRLTELGETGNIDTIASAVAKAIAIEQTAVASEVFRGDINETKLTRAEKNALKNSTYGKQVQSEIAQGMSTDAFTGEVDDFNRSNVRNNPYVAPKVTSNVVDFYNNQKKIANIDSNTTDVRKNRATDIPVRKSTAVDTSKVSDSGNTEVVVDGNKQEASISKVTAVNKDGSFNVELDNGTTVNSSDVLYSSASEALVYETIPKMVGNPGVANTVINAYKNSNIPADTFVDESMYAYQYGKTNQSKRLADLTNLPDNVKNTLFVVGRDNAKAESQSRAKPDTKVTKQSNKAILVNDVDEKQLTPKQKTFKSVADAIAKISNLDVYLFESYRKNGKIYNNINGVEVESGANGWYVEGSNAIYLDLNAGNNSEGLGLFTLSHEIGHAIREWSTAKWQTLADTVVEAIDNQAEIDSNTPTFEEMMADKLAKYKRFREAGNENYNYTDEQLEDMAYEDVVSDSFEKLMADEQTFSEIMDNIKQQDKSLWQKIKDFFKDFVNKLGNVLKSYEGVDPETEAGKAVAQAQDMYDKIRSLYADAFTDANRNIAEAMTPEEAERNQFSTDTLTGSQDGFVVKDATALPVSSITGVKQSTSTEREALPKMMMSVTGGENKIITSGMLGSITALKTEGKVPGKAIDAYTVAQVREYAMNKNGFTKKQISNVQKFMDDMAKFMDDAGVRYRFIELKDVKEAKLHYQYNKDGSIKAIVLSAMIKNGDYPVNFDLTSICKKRAAMSELIEKLSKKGVIDSDTVKLTQKMIFKINTVLKNEGFETACLGCFVESKRYNIRKWASTFIEKYNAAVLKVNPEATYFNFTQGDVDFDNMSIEDVISLDDSLEKFANSNGAKSKANAKAKYRQMRDNGELIFKDKEGKRKGYTEGQKKKIDQSLDLTSDEKNYFLSKNPNDLSVEELDILIDAGIFSKNVDNVQRVTSLVNSSSVYQHLLKPSDLLTKDGIRQLEQLPNFHGVLYGHYGSGTPKLVQGFTPYNSEIALLPENKGKQSLTEYLKSIAGVRIQSFSDFQIQNIYDYLQIVADLTARRLPAHAYTKEISFAKLLGMTGIKGNLSVMFDIDPDVDMEHAGLTKYNPEIHKGEYAKIVLSDEQGDWVYNIGDYATQKAYDNYYKSKGLNVAKRFLQSIGFADAVNLQTTPGYSSNLGIIGVGYSAKHIQAMLNDDRIRYIIPYHSSSLPADIKTATNLKMAKDYTSVQNTTKIESILDRDKNPVDYSIKKAYKRLGSGKAVLAELNEHVRNDGWQIKTKKAQNGHGSFKLYENLDESQDPRTTAENFFDWCAGNGTLPVFYEFADHDNYYKVLYDFNVYDCITGEYAPQTEVQNIYPDSNGKPVNIANREYVSGKDGMTGYQGIIDDYMMWQNSYNMQLDNRLDKIADDLIGGKRKLSNGESMINSTDYDNISSSPKKLSERDASMTEERIDDLIDDSGAGMRKDYAQSWITSINPSDFLNLTLGLANQDRDRFDTMPGDYGSTVNDYDYIEALKQEKRQTPYLAINVDTGEVVGHEGRHRMRALEKAGITSADIKVQFRDDDGYLIKELNGYGNPLEIIDSIKVFNQRGTGQSAILNNVIPLNKANRDNIINSYGSKDAAIRYSERGNGYDGYSMSNNARAAYDNGEMPLSKWTKANIVEAVSEINPDIDISKINLETLRNKFLSQSSWHHTSMYYNKTDFYSIRESYIEDLTQDDVDNIVSNQTSTKKERDKSYDERIDDAYKKVQLIVYAGLRKNEDTAWKLFYTPDKFNEVYDKAISTLKKTNGKKVEQWKLLPDDDFHHELVNLYQTDFDAYIDKWYEINKLSRKSKLFDLIKTQIIIQDKIKENRKIKESDRSALTDNRSLLANAFNSIVQNPAEAQILEDYQANIDKMNAEEDKLRTLTAEMKQLSFGKGKRDKSKITKLQNEITKTKNRINIYDKKLLKLEASKPLQNVIAREKDKVIKREKAKYKQALAEEKQKRTDAIQTLKAKNKEKIDKRKSTEVRNKIKKIASDLENRLLNGTERRYIPRQLVESVINVCDSIDPTGKDQNSKSAQKWKSGRAALAELKMAYDKLENFNDYDFSYEFDKDFSNLIGDFADAVGDTPLRDMSREQLEDVYTIVHDIRNMLNDATKQIGIDEAISNYEAGQEVIENMRNVKSRKQTTNAVSDFFRNWTENPMRAVREMTGYDPEARLTKIFDELNKGRRKADDFRMKMQKKFDALRTSKDDAKKFNSAVQDKVELGLLDTEGNPMKITKMQAMTILLTYDRERSNKDRKHLVTPVLIPDADLERKGKYAQAKDKGRQLLVTDDLITKINSQLNEWDKQYITTAKEFFNDDSQKAINEVSMVTKHRPIATEKEYIPYIVDKDYVKKESENVKFDATIEGTGILKSMQKNATQQLLIKSLNELIADHIDNVAKIYGLAVPVRNFNKVFNMQQTVADGGVSVQRAIRDVWKDGGVKLVDQAVADLQSPRRGDTAKILSVAKSGFVTSTLASNISVWMKQAASYPTAGAVLSNTSLTKGLAKYIGRKSSDVWQEIDEHTSQHYMRRQGLSMQELGELNQTKGWQNTINSKLGKASPMNWIQAMDVATTAALWEASKAEAEKQGTMPSDDSYWKVVTDIYNRVIEDTQPMYDSLHRAEITKNKALSNVILFQTQPIQNSGILREGAMRYKDMKKAYGSKDAKTKQAFKSYRMAVTSQMASHLTFTMMTLAAAAILHKMNPYRDDNKELTIESLLEEFGKQFGKNVFNAIVPVFGNYAVSIAEKIFGGSTYDVLSDATVDKINSTIDVFAKVKQKPTVENIINVFTEVASYLGVPANNIKNIVNGIRLHLKDIENGEFGSFESGVKRTNSQDIDRAYTYYSEGDLQKSKEIIQSKIDDKIASGKEEKEAKSDIRGSLTGYLKPIYLEAYKNKDNAKMTEIRKYMKETGCYGKTDDITKACQDWIKQSKKK